jgi:glycosyltransferase involved in cell wall biosynthesis
MSHMRIAYVSDMYSIDHGGGVTAGRHFVEKLREQGHEVVVVATDATGPQAVRMPAFHLPVRAMREMHFEMAVPDRKQLAKIFANVDVVHLQFPFWLSFAALAEARRAGLPVVAGFHLQPENMLWNVGVHSDFLNDIVYRQWMNRLYEQVDTVVCPTAFAERKLRDHGLTTPTVVITNGIPDDIVPSRQPHRSDPSGDFRILIAGRLASEKRQEDLIDAIAKSAHKDKIRLVMAGGGPREQEMVDRARALPNGAKVGFLPRAELLAQFEEADLLVHCSGVELEGIVVNEATAFGLPALVAQSPESAASELAKDDDFRFPVGDSDALAQRIDHLIENPAKLAQARAWAEGRAPSLSIEESARHLAYAYEDAIAARQLRSIA